MALTDWELWACANQQIDRYGDLAPEAAAMQADLLLENGDLAGHSTWQAILLRINELQRSRCGDIIH